MMHIATKLILVASASCLLAACGSDGKGSPGGGGGGGGGGVPPTAKLEDAFGVAFATTFQRSPNSDPREPAAGDAGSVAVNGDPQPVP